MYDDPYQKAQTNLSDFCDIFLSFIYFSTSSSVMILEKYVFK